MTWKNKSKNVIIKKTLLSYRLKFRGKRDGKNPTVAKTNKRKLIILWKRAVYDSK